MQAKYDSENHIYEINGVVVPSITQLLPEQEFYVSESRLVELAEEGSDNHSMIKMFFDTGDTYNDPMLDALSHFIIYNESFFGNLVHYEKPLFSQKLMFGGTPDAVFENAIVEFKRSFGKKRYHALQIAGHQILAKENGIIKKTKKWYVAWFDGEVFKKRNVYNNHAEVIFRGLVNKYYIDKAVQNYMEE